VKGLELGSLAERNIQLNNDEERLLVERFLEKFSLRLERDVEYTIAIVDDDRIVATGSFSDNVLKCIAVDSRYEGMGLAGMVVSRLVTEEYNRGRLHLFIYTKPENISKFHELGFHVVAEVPSKVALLENRPDGITGYVEKLKSHRVSGGFIGSIVVNCNPFTKGHKYLIEKAASECDWLHVFVVWEDRSVFPSEIRYHLVREGIKHINNVTVHKGKDYIVSNATFPTYFLKQLDDAVDIQCMLDIKIFAEHIAPALGIKKRYVGKEPYCPVTGAYNRTMKEILPGYGIEVIEVPRISLNGVVISASEVRKQLRAGNMEVVKELVPATTYDFLVSEEAIPILEKISI
jgi:[citrate (pro-3S)-lyase] ligase